MNIISVRESTEHCERTIEYISSKWPSVSPAVYRDCIYHSITAAAPLPQWYILEKEGEWIGCAGLVTNDFISRMDLYPWLCALFIEVDHRGRSYGSLLIEKARLDARRFGFGNIYLATDLIGYYEKYGFRYIGEGFHPWEERSRIYSAPTE